MGQINLLKTDTPQTPASGRVGFFIDSLNAPILILDDGTEIPLGEGVLDQSIIDALNSADSPNGTNPYVTISQLQTLLGSNNRLLNDVSVQWSGTGLVFDISEAVYYIDGQLYTEVAGQVTLDASDPTNPRIDVFYVDINGFGKLTGTPSATPVKPLIDPVTQIELSFVQIDAAATTPTVTSENVYLENTEWVTSSSGTGTFNADSTADPFAGTKAFEVTSIQNGGTMIFTRASDIDLTSYVSLGFHLKLKATMNNGRNIFVQFFDVSDNAISNQLSFSIDKSNSTTYQFCGLNLNAFTFSDRTIVRKIKISYNGSGGSATYTGFFADNIILQFGIQNSLTPYLTSDEIQAIKGASSPSSSNTFVTQAELVGGIYPEMQVREDNELLFDNDYSTGIEAAARSGNITASFTGAKRGACTVMRHNDASAFTYPTENIIISGTYEASLDNYLFFLLVNKTASSEVILCTISQEI